ncbi:hypothetical protein [Limnoglobus roseus]|nr:hypothetical protein [Limnoglobus roseus]
MEFPRVEDPDLRRRCAVALARAGFAEEPDPTRRGVSVWVCNDNDTAE